jgi:hypothetical protein
MVGILPSAVNVVHAVAGAADLRAAGGMISANRDGYEERTGNDAGGQESLRGQADEVFPVHSRIPCSCWIGYRIATPRTLK